MKGLASTGLGIIGGITNSTFSSNQAENMKRRMAAMNFGYNERAAQNAMQRGLYMYNNTQSWAAQMKQLKEAGLSPGLILGNATSGGAVNGPQGGGGAGQSGEAVISPLEAANLGLIKAQTEKTEVEAKNIAKNTEKQDVEIGNILMDTGLKSAQIIGQNLNNAGTKLSNIRQEIAIAKDFNELLIQTNTLEEQIEVIKVECQRVVRMNDIEEATKQYTVAQALGNATSSLTEALLRIKELETFDERFQNEMDEILSRIKLNKANAGMAKAESVSKQYENRLNEALKDFYETKEAFEKLQKIAFGNEHRIYLPDENGNYSGYKKAIRGAREVIQTIEPIADIVEDFAGKAIMTKAMKEAAEINQEGRVEAAREISRAKEYAKQRRR